MVASTQSFGSFSIGELRRRFLTILPKIKTHARIHFRDRRCRSTKADFVAEVVAIAWKWFLRLYERGKDPLLFPSALATYAVKAVRGGRRLCGQLKAKDVLSERAQQRHGFTVSVLPTSVRTSHENLYGAVDGQRRQDEYEERLQDNTRTPPDEQAMFRIDFGQWLKSLTARERKIIKAMLRNERTKDLAKHFQLSQARISQLRREFHEDWTRYCSAPDEQ
jgi:hypothetical protein